MNIEAVNELIASLESAGELTIREEKFLKLAKAYVQLAAENAKLADCANFYRLGFRPVKGTFGIEYRPTEQLLDDCGNTAIEAIKTPATSAYLDGIKADVVEEFLASLPSYGDTEVDTYDDGVKAAIETTQTVYGPMFIKQLREGAK